MIFDKFCCKFDNKLCFRFDELQEDDIEDCILNPTDQSTGISLAEQQEILELWC